MHNHIPDGSLSAGIVKSFVSTWQLRVVPTTNVPCPSFVAPAPNPQACKSYGPLIKGVFSGIPKISEPALFNLNIFPTAAGVANRCFHSEIPHNSKAESTYFLFFTSKKGNEASEGSTVISPVNLCAIESRQYPATFAFFKDSGSCSAK